MKRTLVILLASLALASLARTEEPPKKQEKGKAHAAQHAQTNVARHSGSARSGQAEGTRHTNAYNKSAHANAGTNRNVNRAGTAEVNRAQLKRSQTNVVRQNNQLNARNRNVVAHGAGNRDVVVNNGGKRRFAVSSGNNISFAQARQWNWHQHHDRSWWVGQGFPIVLYGGGYWYWNQGWWYPAYGYDPYYSRYVYDGPIYGYGNIAPGEVTSEVQRALAQQGYYYGPIDGILGPMTRRAIERFQVERGLPRTAAIDQPTLQSLGLA